MATGATDFTKYLWRACMKCFPPGLWNELIEDLQKLQIRDVIINGQRIGVQTGHDGSKIIGNLAFPKDLCEFELHQVFVNCEATIRVAPGAVALHPCPEDEEAAEDAGTAVEVVPGKPTLNDELLEPEDPDQDPPGIPVDELEEGKNDFWICWDRESNFTVPTPTVEWGELPDDPDLICWKIGCVTVEDGRVTDLEQCWCSDIPCPSLCEDDSGSGGSGVGSGGPPDSGSGAPPTPGGDSCSFEFSRIEFGPIDEDGCCEIRNEVSRATFNLATGKCDIVPIKTETKKVVAKGLTSDPPPSESGPPMSEDGCPIVCADGSWFGVPIKVELTGSPAAGYAGGGYTLTWDAQGNLWVLSDGTDILLNAASGMDDPEGSYMGGNANGSGNVSVTCGACDVDSGSGDGGGGNPGDSGGSGESGSM